MVNGKGKKKKRRRDIRIFFDPRRLHRSSSSSSSSSSSLPSPPSSPPTKAMTTIEGWWSPKLVALVEEVRALKGSKVVVFSQHKNAILHAAKVIESAGIRCVRIVKGDRAERLQEAVQTFNVDQGCTVLLLHAGPAASGLTLTVAQHVILMEPFEKAGEEAQALNRCHRIGQLGRVHCRVLYCKDSVEERMLWHRQRINEIRGDTDSLSLPSSTKNEGWKRSNGSYNRMIMSADRNYNRNDNNNNINNHSGDNNNASSVGERYFEKTKVLLGLMEEEKEESKGEE